MRLSSPVRIEVVLQSVPENALDGVEGQHPPSEVHKLGRTRHRRVTDAGRRTRRVADTMQQCVSPSLLITPGVYCVSFGGKVMCVSCSDCEQVLVCVYLCVCI